MVLTMRLMPTSLHIAVWYWRIWSILRQQTGLVSWGLIIIIIIIMLALPFALRATVKLRGVNEGTLMKFQYVSLSYAK